MRAVFERAERAAKEAWHDVLVAHRDTHVWVLNLYRAGEHHPETVDDYFPWRAAEDAWPELARELKRHAGEERGHTVLYTRAIRALGGEVADLRGLDVFNHAIRRETALRWDVSPGDPLPLRRLALAHFLAHAHCLERRVARSLEHHVRACRAAGRSLVAEVVERVHADEERHVESTLRGLRELTTDDEAARVLGFHAEAEAKADLAFSARQVRAFLRRFPHRGSRLRRAGFLVGATLMDARHG